MKKEIGTKYGSASVVRPDVMRRKVCQTDWWAKNKRIYREGRDGFEDMSYPPGFAI